MGYFQIMDGDNAGLERICMLLYGNTRTIKKLLSMMPLKFMST